MRDHIFISYSHQDRVWLERLRTFLRPLERALNIMVWDDTAIQPGELWRDKIEQGLTSTRVAVLLVSAFFYASEFITCEELPVLLQAAEANQVIIIPIIISSRRFVRESSLVRFQAVNQQPLDGLPDHEVNRILQSVADRCEDLLRTPAVMTAEESWVPDDGRFPDPERAYRDPRHDELLAQIEMICRLRERDLIEVSRRRGGVPPVPYLRVVLQQDGITTIYPIGCSAHGVDAQVLEQFVTLHREYMQRDPGARSLLVYGGDPAPSALVQQAAAQRIRLVSFMAYQGLLDFRTYVREQTRRLEQDPLYSADLYVPQRLRYDIGQDKHSSENALTTLQDWLAEPHGRFILVLGDFGAGKTFVLRRLAHVLGITANSITPILIQMRALERGHSLDALVAMHLADAGMEHIEPRAFRYMLAQGRIVLLFDGFDELVLRITYSRAAEHLRTLIEAATGDAHVVVTSRTQHFLSDRQVRQALYEQIAHIPHHRIVTLEPFDVGRIRQFVVNRLRDHTQAESRLQLLDQVKDLMGLSANPRMLSFIVDLPEVDLRQAQAREGQVTAARLYELLLERWLVGEYERMQPRGAAPTLSTQDRWQAATELALCLWRKTEATVHEQELTDAVSRALATLPALQLQPEQAAHQVGSGTLLVRDSEGNFSFIHQSVMEWLVAHQAAEQLHTTDDETLLITRPLSPLMADFCKDLVGKEQMITWAQQTFANATASECARHNARLIMDRLGVQFQQGVQLAGVDMRGQDLSGQNLSHANLREADLREARLIKSDLRRAVLMRAQLDSADLSQAVLNGADLRQAKLSGAKLLGVDLRGAQLAGSILRRARLVGAHLDEGALNICDHTGYAPPVPEHITALITPSASSCSAVAWSPDGIWLASGHADGSIRMWDKASRLEIYRMLGYTDRITSIIFNPEGSLLASGRDDGSIQMWDIATGQV
jgi:uncharacterized protein YjbI with pentapeptide repeats